MSNSDKMIESDDVMFVISDCQNTNCPAGGGAAPEKSDTTKSPDWMPIGIRPKKCGCNIVVSMGSIPLMV